MQNECWEANHAVFEKLDVLSAQPEATPTPQPAAEGENAADAPAAPVMSPPPMLTLVSVRSEVRTQLDRLRMVLHDHYTERDAYLVLFPIVTHLDEYVQTNLLSQNHPKAAYFSRLMKWPTLQKELFDIEDGGVLFYDTLDDLLRKPQTPTFVYEVYLLCLNHGFQGKYNDNAVKLSEYKKKLSEKIPVGTPPELGARRSTKPMAKTVSHYWYYAGALAVVLVVYGFFHTMAQAYVQSPPPVVAAVAEEDADVAEPKAAAPTADEKYYVQCGPLYDDEASAQRTASFIKIYGVTTKVITTPDDDGKDWYRVLMGNPSKESDAKRVAGHYTAQNRFGAELQGERYTVYEKAE